MMIILLIAIICIACGLVTIVWVNRTAKHERTEAWIIGVSMIVCGVLGIVGVIIDNDALMLTAVLPFTSLLLIYVPIKVARQRKQCNCPVVANCVKYNRYSGGKGPDSYAPVFEYTYAGIRYERQTLVTYSLREIQNIYKIGNSYQIYINEDCPEMCVDTKKFPMIHIFVFLTGIGMMALYLWLILGMVG